MKLIALYLPQFHTIPENDKWWGEGFTEWVNVKKAKPLFDNHLQPRVPLEKNYYDLSDVEVMKWQTDIAKKYGIYGFCFYHYWFDGHLLLQKPIENFLEHKEIDFPFCICWANEHWTNAWVSKENSVLIEQRYGKEKDWRAHFEYLLPFFLDNRSIKVDEKPLVVIYRPELIDCLNPMLDAWQKWAEEAGLPGLHIAYQHVTYFLDKNKDDSRFDSYIEYQPIFETSLERQKKFTLLRKIKRKIDNILEKSFAIDTRHISVKQKVTINDYDEIWRNILARKPDSSKAIPGAFVNWDNTPRKAERGSVIYGSTPEKFENYMTQQIKNAKEVYQKDMMFIFAWNEWAEGGFLEPDEEYGYGYLQAIKNALHKNGY